MNAPEYEIMRRVEDSHWWYRNLHALVIDALKSCAPDPALPILDGGCGTGAMIDRLHSRYRIVGLDFSPLALAFTRARGHRELVRGNISRIPFRRGSFSAVISLDVIIHRAAGPASGSIAELARVTAPGGYVILNVPAYEWLRSPHDEQVQTAHRFSRGELLRVVESVGLEVVQCTHWNTLLMPAIVAMRFAKRIAGSTKSDLAEYRPGLGMALCGAIVSVERALLRMFRLPAGVSIFVVARKKPM